MRRISPTKKAPVKKSKSTKAPTVAKPAPRQKAIFAPAISSTVVDEGPGINFVTQPVAGEIPVKSVSLLTDEQIGVDSTPITDEDIKALEEHMLIVDLTINVLPNGKPDLYDIDVRIPGYDCQPIIMHHVSMCEKYGEIALRMSESKWPPSLVFTPSKELAKNLLTLLRHTNKISKSSAQYRAPTPEPAGSPTKDALGIKVIPLKKKTPPARSQTTMANPTYLPLDARVIPKEVKDKQDNTWEHMAKQAGPQKLGDPNKMPPTFAEGIWNIIGMPQGIVKKAMDAVAPASLPSTGTITLDKLAESMGMALEKVENAYKIPEIAAAVKSSQLQPDESAELASLFSQSSTEKVVEPTNDFVDELLASEDNDKKEEISIKQLARERAKKSHQDFLDNWGSPVEMREVLENNTHQIIMDSIMFSNQLQKVVAAIYEEAVCHKGGLSSLELGIDLQVTVTSPEKPRSPIASVSLRNLVMN